MSSQASRRSQSPIKERLGDTRFLSVPISIIPLESHKIPKEVESLYKDMRHISKGTGVVPRSAQQVMKDYGEDVAPFELMDVGLASDASAKTAPPQVVADLWQIALDCQRRSAPEATWNSEVYSRIFRMALDGHWQTKSIWYQDITTARVADKCLVPSVATKPMESKLVDYAITLDPSTIFLDRIVSKLNELRHLSIESMNSNATSSINCTSAEWIRFNPIAISIETKRAAILQDEAHLQLGIWTAAHFAKLRQLMQHSRRLESKDLPILPVILVQGHDWKMMFARYLITGSEAHLEILGSLLRYLITGSEAHLEILGSLLLSDTGSLGGVYCVLGAIGRLAKWVDERYHPWFEETILADSV